MDADDVLDRPADDLPDAVRREMQRMARGREPASPPQAQARVMPFRPAPPPAEPAAPAHAEDDPPHGSGPESFDPEGTDYKACGWAGNKTLASLVIILKDGTECGFNYGDLASAWPGGSMFARSAPGCKGNVIRLRIAGDDGTFIVVIEGGLLRPVWGLVMAHKAPWIRELPDGLEFAAADQPVIRSIAFVEPPRLADAKRR